MTTPRPCDHDDPFASPGRSDGVITARVAGGTRRSAIAWVVVLIVLVGVGVAGRLSGAPAAAGVSTAAGMSTAAASAASRVSSSAGLGAAPPTGSTGSTGAIGAIGSGGAAGSLPGASTSPLPGEMLLADPATLAPRATLSVPVVGSSWVDLAQVPVAGVFTGGLPRVLVTVTSDRLLLGQADLAVGTSGRFAGFVPITPPPSWQPAQVRVIDPGPPAALLALTPVSLGSARRLLVSEPVSLTATAAGERVQLQGLVRRDATRVEVRIRTALGLSPAGAAVLDAPVPAATSYLALWRTFRATVQLPHGARCGDAWVEVQGIWPAGDPSSGNPAGDVVDVPACPAG